MSPDSSLGVGNNSWKAFMKYMQLYLHESRHVHTLKRARGPGGRFLNKKKVQDSKPNTLNQWREPAPSFHPLEVILGSNFFGKSSSA
ncbi:hypothetical protein ACFX12_024865 [Malus domestica]